MAYSSDDELPDIQLLLEQRIAKSKTEKMALPPSLFDPVTPPKPKPKLRSKPKAVDQTIQPKIVRKGKEAVADALDGDDDTLQGPKEVKAKRITTVKKQTLKAAAREITVEKPARAAVGNTGSGVVAYPEVSSLLIASLIPSDYLDHGLTIGGDAMEKIQPAPQRRRRLIQKKYLPSDDESDDDDDDSDTENNQETVKKLQRAIVDFTFSDLEEELPRVQQPKAGTKNAMSEDEGFESHGSKSTPDDICGAILTYSPPRSVKPRKVVLPANPTKTPSTERKLSSPKKKAPRIPPSQHRLSSDAFWDQGATNSWVDSHTSRETSGVVRNTFDTADDDILEDLNDDKEEEIVEIKRPTASRAISSSTSRNTAPKESKEKFESKKSFNVRKKQLAEEFLKTVDDKISNGEVAKITASTGGVRIVWSKTLRTTAGTARWRMEKLKNASGQVSLGDPLSTEAVRHHATIDLSEKVVDNEEKLYNVLCHEYCHLANYMISNVRKPPHGDSFKRWASLCTRAFSNVNVHVTTTHSYEIEAKYKWACQTCGYVYKRHSQSIDITRYSCGACKGGKLAQTHPPPREKRPITGYQAFMKENFGRIKAENPGTPQREVMKIVAEAYRAAKSVECPGKPGFAEVGEKEGEFEDMFGGLKV